MTTNYLNLSAPIFNIQSYSIHDGPGIRVTVFEKGCPLHCVWCANPESNSPVPQLMTYSSKCTGCGLCVSECDKAAISVVTDGNKAYSITDRSKCIDCGKCTAVCQADAREIAGREMTVEEVLTRVERDRMFFGKDGGITLSGGECLMHPDFTEAVLYEAKKRGIHTAVESCAYASRDVIDRVFRYVDLALLDIKEMDSACHKQYTGVPNEMILENICYIYCNLKKQVHIRVPVVPGFNADDENILAIASFVKDKLGTDVPVNLLPYHRMGESKAESLGREMNLNIEVPDSPFMAHLAELVQSKGVPCSIVG